MKKARIPLLVGGAFLAAGAVAWMLWPRPLGVEVGPVARGPLRVTVEGPGKARVHDRYLVTAPVAGDLVRPSIRAGDAVKEGQVVAVVRPARPPPLDERTTAELRARLEAARAAESEARAAEDRARHAATQADRDRIRARALASGGSIAAQDLEAAESAADEAAHAVEMSQAAVQRAARAAEGTQALLGERHARGGAPVEVRAPAPGKVLRVLQESEGPVAAGTPLLEIGDLERIELRLDLLTTEAVRVRPGAQVDLVNWGGDRVLPGKVRSVEPSAFTKISALGVEEQRVNVLVDPSAPGAWAQLADGYSADGRVVVAERPDALLVPAGALFRSDGRWAVLVVEDGRARLRTVKVGDPSGASVEVLDGLSAGDLVIVHPGDKVKEGARVRGMPSGASRP